jgi:ABC-2 type transport system permease protein
MTWRPFQAVVQRELLKLVRQRGRLVAQMVRPLIWLFVIGGGLGAVMSRQGIADYQRFLVPGVLGMTMLFGAMLGAFSAVYDKESGVMRLLVIAPAAHAWVVAAKILGATVVALVQGSMLLVVLVAIGYVGTDVSPGLLLMGMVATSLACAATGMAVATFSGTLENYAVMMNVVIFPMYFISGALYPFAMLPDALRAAALVNPFTYGVDLVKHAMPYAHGAFGAPELPLAWDLAAVAGLVAIAASVACVRFSQGAACEPLVHPQALRRARAGLPGL